MKRYTISTRPSSSGNWNFSAGWDEPDEHGIRRTDVHIGDNDIALEYQEVDEGVAQFYMLKNIAESLQAIRTILMTSDKQEKQGSEADSETRQPVSTTSLRDDDASLIARLRSEMDDAQRDLIRWADRPHRVVYAQQRIARIESRLREAGA